LAKHHPVVEKFSELELIVKYAKLHNVKPSIGVRVKLAARARRWEQSGASRSKFGLFISEVMEALEYLRRAGMGDCLNSCTFTLARRSTHPQHQARDHRAGARVRGKCSAWERACK